MDVATCAPAYLLIKWWNYTTTRHSTHEFTAQSTADENVTQAGWVGARGLHGSPSLCLLGRGMWLHFWSCGSNWLGESRRDFRLLESTVSGSFSYPQRSAFNSLACAVAYRPDEVAPAALLSLRTTACSHLLEAQCSHIPTILLAPSDLLSCSCILLKLCHYPAWEYSIPVVGLMRKSYISFKWLSYHFSVEKCHTFCTCW